MSHRVYVGMRYGLVQQGVEDYLASQEMKCVPRRKYRPNMLINVCVTDDTNDVEKFSSAQVPTVLCADFSCRTDVMNALRQGAHACVSVWGSFKHLRIAIERACIGRQYICPTLSEAMCNSAERICPPDLTPRESVVASWISAGYTSKQIGRKLGVSPYTVETHRRNIMQKIGAHKVTELTRYAIAHERSEICNL